MPLFTSNSKKDAATAPENTDLSHLGYLPDFPLHYRKGKQIGKGGSGTVYTVTRIEDNAEFACKVIPKVLQDPLASDRKRELHLPSIKQEIEVMLALRGNLSVVNLEAVYEDKNSVYLVMELCHGGPVVGRAGPGRHPTYSERTVASYIRSVLQTVNQCHARNIIHRDIKPENFLLLSEAPTSPLKAIDFGLATFFTPASLPLKAPNVEGTPWYLSPEACRGKWWPSTDVWACGVMAAYMLTGNYPFVDRINPVMPDLARTLRVICFEELDVSGTEWKRLSQEAVDFVSHLLVKDPGARPSAAEALKHPWLQDGPEKKEHPLHHSVVQRIQRFAQNSLFKRKVLEHIAHDLVSMHFSPTADKSAHGGAVFTERSVRGGRAYYSGGPGGASGGGGAAGGGGSRKGSGSNDASRRSAFFGSVRNGNFFFGGGGNASVRGGSNFIGGSVRGGGGGSREGSRRPDMSMRGDSVRGGSNLQQIPSGVYLPVATPFSRRLAVLLDSLGTGPDGKVQRTDLQSSLQRLGYKIDEREAGELFDAVDIDRTGVVPREALTASLLDWKSLQDTFKDRWVESMTRVFAELDVDGDGALSADEVAAAFKGQLCEYEVDAAVHEALVEAAGSASEDGGGAEGGEGGNEGDNGNKGRIDFDHFVRLLQGGKNLEDLGLYDDRLSEHTSRMGSGEIPEYTQGGGGGLFSCCFGGGGS